MITIIEATIKDSKTIADLVAKLLKDLNKKSDRDFNVDKDYLERVTKKLITRNNYVAFIAFNMASNPIGLITIAEAFAIYNGGDYGVITELYVNKNSRSQGIGSMLLKSAFEFSKTMNWKHIEVGAPRENKWPRTISFYTDNGFEIKGPKLRIEL